MASLLIEIIGWIGAIMILLAYFLLTQKKLTGESRTYHLINLLGGLAVGINALVNVAYPSVALNMIWSLIAIYGIVKGLGLPKKK